MRAAACGWKADCQSFQAAPCGTTCTQNFELSRPRHARADHGAQSTDFHPPRDRGKARSQHFCARSHAMVLLEQALIAIEEGAISIVYVAQRRSRHHWHPVSLTRRDRLARTLVQRSHRLHGRSLSATDMPRLSQTMESNTTVTSLRCARARRVTGHAHGRTHSLQSSPLCVLHWRTLPLTLLPPAWQATIWMQTVRQHWRQCWLGTRHCAALSARSRGATVRRVVFVATPHPADRVHGCAACLDAGSGQRAWSVWSLP